MQYYIIANNTQISEYSISRLILDGSNVVIVFNYMIPLRFSKILDYLNKICISRKASDTNCSERYANIAQIKQYEDYFNQICFHSHPSHMTEPYRTIYSAAINEHNFNPNKLFILDYDKTNIRGKIRYPAGKSISTGLIAYEYIKSIKNSSDTICLVGFTSEVSTKFHHAQWEKLYMLNEISLNNCRFMQSYGLSDRI
jgi:hypothetical protein